ncbi:MAG: N-acetyltransferase [Chloroflexi bacterium]|nr:N-acetyltransferase [Chloroflexota bacterium]
MKAPKAQVEKARIDDVLQIHRLVNYYAERGEMLARPLSEIYENVRDFFIIRDGDRVAACAAFHILWADLAEVKSLAVAHDLQGQRLGTQLVKACLGEAQGLGIGTVFCLTYKPDFFQHLGFRQVTLMELPRKVWGECLRCPKFPNCDEVALIYQWEAKPLSQVGIA